MRWRYVQTAVSLVAVLVRMPLAYSHELPEKPLSALQIPAVPSGFVEQASRNVVASCLEPPQLPGLSDYDGPMKKTVGLFARALERKSGHEAHYKAGVPLCALRAHDRFLLFVEDSIDPLTFLSAGFDAGTDQASNRDSAFGQGGSGYAKRFGADLADRVSSQFFKDFAYPAMFSEDPRYYRLGHGGARRRLVHAAEHLVIAHHADGTRMFNYSQWLGTGSAVALSNLYHPGNERGAGAMARRVGYGFAGSMGFDVLREFWPEIARKFKLPFRGISTQAVSPPGGAAP
jgi:hypothetical protein